MCVCTHVRMCVGPHPEVYTFIPCSIVLHFGVGGILQGIKVHVCTTHGTRVGFLAEKLKVDTVY